MGNRQIEKQFESSVDVFFSSPKMTEILSFKFLKKISNLM